MISYAEYKRVFIFLSLMFVLYFYVFPLLVFTLVGEVEYLGARFVFEESYGMYLSIVLFLMGFYLSSKIRLNSNLGDLFFTSADVKASRIFWFFLIAVSAYLISEISNFQRYEALYAIRRGDVEGSHLGLLRNLFVAGFKYALFLTLVAIKKRKLALFFLMIVVVHQITGAAGRTNLLITLCVLMMTMFRFSAMKTALISLCAIGLSMPVILSLKLVIYSIVTNTFSFSSLSNLSFSAELYFESFGHVLFSFFNREQFIEECGYRYFYDYIQGFLFYFKVIGLDFGNSITYCNTKVLLGVEDSIIPPGYLLLGFSQLGYVGIFFSGVVYFLIGKLGYYALVKSRVWQQEAVFLIAFLCANSFYYGDFRVMVMTLFIPLMVIGLSRLFVNVKE